MTALLIAISRRIAFHRDRQGRENAFEASYYNRWETSEMLIRELEALAEELVQSSKQDRAGEGLD